MIQPVNGHLLIEPVEHETFMQTDQGTYEEIGTVLALPLDMVSYFEVNSTGTSGGQNDLVNLGDKVYFDAWLAAKFPGENDGEYYWLVKWEHIRAIEHVERQVPEQSV